MLILISGMKPEEGTEMPYVNYSFYIIVSMKAHDFSEEKARVLFMLFYRLSIPKAAGAAIPGPAVPAWPLS